MKPTPTMNKAIELAHLCGGSLYRHAGGFWGAPNWELGEEYYSTNTINGLVIRGLAEYSEYKEGRNGRFPVEITLKQHDDDQTEILDKAV